MSQYTAEDFAEAKWCLHPHGMFGHRFGYDPNSPWAISDGDSRFWRTDDYLAERGDFEPFKPSLTIDFRRLEMLVDKHLPDHDFVTIDNVIDMMQSLGFEITGRGLDLPSEPGVRFKAKKADGPVEWKFVTYFSGIDRGEESVSVICTDTKDYTGQTWSADQFSATFTVTELL